MNVRYFTSGDVEGVLDIYERCFSDMGFSTSVDEDDTFNPGTGNFTLNIYAPGATADGPVLKITYAGTSSSKYFKVGTTLDGVTYNARAASYILSGMAGAVIGNEKMVFSPLGISSTGTQGEFYAFVKTSDNKIACFSGRKINAGDRTECFRVSGKGAESVYYYLPTESVCSYFGSSNSNTLMMIPAAFVGFSAQGLYWVAIGGAEYCGSSSPAFAPSGVNSLKYVEIAGQRYALLWGFAVLDPSV